MLLDVNVLFALSWDQHIHHGAAHSHFASLTQWSTTPVTEAGLVRLLITERVVGRKVKPAAALAQLRALREVPGWSFMPDTATFADPHIDLRVLMERRQVTDLHLVNLVAAHGGRLATFDVGLRDALTPADQHWVDVWSPS